MAIGRKGGGYASLSPTQNYLGQAMSKAEDSAFKYREEKRLAQTEEKQKEADLQSQRTKELEASDKFDKDHPILKTGQDKIDNPTTLASFEFKKKFADANKNYELTGDRKYFDERENAKNSIIGLAQFPNRLVEYNTNLEKGVLDGTYNEHSALKLAKFKENIDKGLWTYTSDEKGNPLITVYEADDNGKVTNIVKDRLSPDKLMSEMNPIPSFNYNGESGKKGSKSFIETFQESLDKKLSKESKDGKIITTVKNAEDLANSASDDLIKDYSAVYQLDLLAGHEPKDKLSDYKPEELDALKQKAYNDLIKRVPYSEEVDYQAKSANLAERKLKQDEKQHNENLAQRKEQANQETVSVKEGETVTSYGQKIPTTTTTTTSKRPKGQVSQEYTNVQETNKGKIGIKNGKWYDIKTGKEIK